MTQLFSCVVLVIGFQSNIYNIQIESVAGNNISMASYSNKKILITTISSVSPSVNQLQFLDSIQNADTSLRIIAVPAKDIDGVGNDMVIASLIDSLDLNIVVTKSAYVKKSAGNNQFPLFKWLTDVNENMHFNTDVESIGQFFIVSKNGILYSVLGNDVPPEIFNQVLSQNIDQ